jgi:hypothetical protein
MKSYKNYLFTAAIIVLLGLLSTLSAQRPAIPPTTHLISQSALLTGLASHAVFPFIDSTPNSITSAHIAITDATSNCAPGAAPPSNIGILVGEAGGTLLPVMTAATNTGISTTPGQCVFHVTVHPGVGGVPANVTDIVVLNGSSSPLTGINTITVSAEVQ